MLRVLSQKDSPEETSSSSPIVRRRLPSWPLNLVFVGSRTRKSQEKAPSHLPVTVGGRCRRSFKSTLLSPPLSLSLSFGVLGGLYNNQKDETMSFMMVWKISQWWVQAASMMFVLSFHIDNRGVTWGWHLLWVFQCYMGVLEQKYDKQGRFLCFLIVV